MFAHRSTELERIDTGDHTPEEYQRFLKEIAFINRYFGDGRALRKSLFREIDDVRLREFSLLDVGCGSGELLRVAAELARGRNIRFRLVGIDLNAIAVDMAKRSSRTFPEISLLRGDAFRLPFQDRSFDYVVSSLFMHHLDDEQIPIALDEMSRVARHGVFVIDLERSRVAFYLYKLFCFAFRISPLVAEDGALSVRKGFKKNELDLRSPEAHCSRSFPFRLVLSLPASRPSDDGLG